MTQSIGMLYDHELADADRLWRRLLEDRQETLMNPQDFVDEVKEEFAAKVGLVVDVKAYTTGKVVGQHPITGEDIVEEVPGLYSFDIEIIGRTEAHEFDHDRMAHEVRNNLLGLRDDGPSEIKFDAASMRAAEQHAKGHKH